jgi:hypothetical protein
VQNLTTCLCQCPPANCGVNYVQDPSSCACVCSPQAPDCDGTCCPTTTHRCAGNVSGPGRCIHQCSPSTTTTTCQTGGAVCAYGAGGHSDPCICATTTEDTIACVKSTDCVEGTTCTSGTECPADRACVRAGANTRCARVCPLL